MTTTTTAPRTAEKVGALTIIPFLHTQGCRTYLLADPVSKQALALDVHLDLAEELAARVKSEGWTLPYIVDSHTHADHPSGAGALAPQFSSTGIAHEAATACRNEPTFEKTAAVHNARKWGTRSGSMEDRIDIHDQPNACPIESIRRRPAWNTAAWIGSTSETTPAASRPPRRRRRTRPS